MGDKDSHQITKGSLRAAISAVIVVLASTGFGRADCPGAGCPAISIGGNDCPGAGCPAFANRIEQQKTYLDLFGALQSGGSAPRPVESRLLLSLPFEGSETTLEPDDPFFSSTCASYAGFGVERIEVLGLSASQGDALAEARADSVAHYLAEACSPSQCALENCPNVTTRLPGDSDALPEMLTLDGSTTLIELRVVP
ncbi:MAG: hypothetical protein AAGF46_07510 [Pseudomonadota bacterium]